MAEKLTAQQQMAVDSRGGKLLVSAAAGSGKTKVLVDRLLGYLADPVDPANIDDFLIITYTKAAAAELRGKIAAKLTQRIAEDPSKRHLQRQMQRLYLTKISTVHSFCTDLLREYAYALDISADFRVADERECLELQLKVIDQVLDDAYAHAAQDPDFCAFVDTQGLGRDDRQVPEILLKVYNSARCHLDPEGWLAWCESACDTGALTDAGETLWGAYLMKDLQDYLQLHVDAFNRCIAEAKLCQGFEKPVELLHSTVSQLQALRDSKNWDEISARRDVDYGRMVFPRKCTDPELAERIKAVRAACKKGVDKKLRSFMDGSKQVLLDMRISGVSARGLISLTRKFTVEYDKLKRSRRILDFGDLEHKTLDLLLGKRRGGPTALASDIGQRYREVMVDEYQDSNAVQDAIFSALTQKRHNCFMVGDVKQSIYQFRLADPDIFLKKYNDFMPAEKAKAEEDRKVLLSSNFRSCGAVVDAVNDVFATCMSPEVGGLHYGDDEALKEGIPHEPLDEPEIELHCIQVDKDTYAEEAAFTAQRICQLLDGTHYIRQDDNMRPIQPEDIVILLRSPGSVGGEFVYALEQCGLSCSTDSGVDLLLTEEISVLRALLTAVSNPLQDIPLVAALTSRLFGFTADDLAAFRSADRKSDLFTALTNDTTEKTRYFLDVLEDLRSQARTVSLTHLLEYTFARTRIDSIYAAMPDGAEKVENLHAFCQLAADCESAGGYDLNRFLEYLDAMAVNGISITGGEDGGGAIRIMSIHKSKGLEFPVVFLCGLSRDFNKESARAQVLCDRDLGLGLSCVDIANRVRYPSVAKRAISAKILSESLSEELRVLYVAMTRAKDRLIMTYASGNLSSEISDLCARMDVSGKLLMTADVNCPGKWVLLTALKHVEAGELFSLGGRPKAIENRGRPWLIRVHDKVPEFTAVKSQELLEQKMDEDAVARIARSLTFVYGHAQATRTPSKQTATQLKGRSKDQEALENAAQSNLTVRKWRKPSFISKQLHADVYGSAIHAVMQFIDYKRCTDSDGIRDEVSRLIKQGFISPEYGEIVDCSMLEHFFLSEMGMKLRMSNNVIREFKFSVLDEGSRYCDGMENEEVLVQGVVDCAIIDDNGITVIDYKTDRVTDDTVGASVERYRAQVELYADALSRIYQLPIKNKYLYYFRLNRLIELPE